LRRYNKAGCFPLAAAAVEAMLRRVHRWVDLDSRHDLVVASRRLLCEDHAHGSADTTVLHICIGVIAGVCFLTILVALFMRRRVRHLEMQLRELFTKVGWCSLTL